MKVRDLIKLMETGDEENVPTIQVAFSNRDWDQFDQVLIDSELLRPIHRMEIDCVAVENGVLRIGIAGKKVCTPLHLDP